MPRTHLVATLAALSMAAGPTLLTTPAVAAPAPALSQTQVERLARDVIAGKYGSGTTRQRALGRNYQVVQKRVNQILSQRKATPAPARKSTPAKRSTTRYPVKLVVNVPLAGGQRVIDSCRGAVLYYGVIVAQHNYCGGTRFHQATRGSYVRLTGKATGTYRVTTIRDYRVGQTITVPGDKALQTSLGGGRVRLWGLTRVA